MMRAGTIRTVAAFEFLSTVKRKGYIIATFGMPLFLLAYVAFISLIGVFVHKEETKVRIYGVVDDAAVLALDGETSRAAMEIPDEIRAALETAGQTEALGPALSFFENFVFRPYDDVGSAKAALIADEIRGIYVLPEDYIESGSIETYLREDLDFQGSESKGALRNLLLDRLLEDKVSDEVADRVRRPIAETVEWTVMSDGGVEQRQIGAVIVKFAVPLVFVILMFVSLMISAGYLLQGTATEKENRVVEVLLCSAKPDELLAGKLLGLGAAALVQVTVWFGMVLLGSAVTVASLELAGIELPWLSLSLCVPFFGAGYLFLGSLMLGTGALGSNLKESQQFSLIWTFVTMVPLVFLQFLLAEPHGTLGRVLTWIPFTTPLTVIFRTAIDAPGVAWWEISGAFAVMLVSTWLAIRMGARLFRVGLLFTGTRPKLREIIRQARLS